jgi:hypothetical protein
VYISRIFSSNFFLGIFIKMGNQADPGCPMYFEVRELKIALARMSSGELFYFGRAKVENDSL